MAFKIIQVWGKQSKNVFLPLIIQVLSKKHKQFPILINPSYYIQLLPPSDHFFQKTRGVLGEFFS
eukprot:UN24093